MHYTRYRKQTKPERVKARITNLHRETTRLAEIIDEFTKRGLPTDNHKERLAHLLARLKEAEDKRCT